MSIAVVAKCGKNDSREIYGNFPYLNTESFRILTVMPLNEMSTFDIKTSKSERHSIYASIGLLISGYLLAIVICDPNMFARFGALIVCVGVIFSIKGIPELLDAVKPIYEKQIEKLRDTYEQACKGHEHEEMLRKYMSENVEPKLTELEQKMSRTLFSVKSRLIRLEGTVVVIGTLVWSFGDYLVPCVSKFCPN